MPIPTFSNNNDAFLEDMGVGTYTTAVYGIVVTQPLKTNGDATGQREGYVFAQTASGSTNAIRKFMITAGYGVALTDTQLTLAPSELLTESKYLTGNVYASSLTADQYEDVVTYLT